MSDSQKRSDLLWRAKTLEDFLKENNHIKDRKYKLKTYKQCFIGQEVLPFIIQLKLCPISMTNKAENEQNALKLGNDLIEANIIQHVTKDHTFKNEKLFYEFIPNYFMNNVTETKGSTETQGATPTKGSTQTKGEDDDDQKAADKKAKIQSMSQQTYTDEPSLNMSVSDTHILAEMEEKRHETLLLERRQSEAQVADANEDELFISLRESLSKDALTIIVFGASGHLAKTKTYPALYDLFIEGVFPENVNIVGYARSKLTKKDFDKKISIKLKGNSVENFLSRCTYFSGKGYDDDESYKLFGEYIAELEDKKYNGSSNRIAYLATPPTVFVAVCERINKYLKVTKGDGGWMRVIIEKPFGKDLDSSNKLDMAISQSLAEEEIYRIDHYLAKEMVQNIIVFRFANVIWDAIWNRKYIRCVKISMKESAALDGRGGYYDEYGVIRDILQNHLFQVLTLIAMEQPCSLRSEDVRDEKVKVLKCIKPMDEKRTVVGQYEQSADGKQLGYRDDPSIKNSDNPNSNQITYVQTVLFIDNHRWAHVPFICKAGKALDARNTEVRIQFKNDGLCLFPDANFNEIVMRLQPNEAIWCKVNTKTPGFARFDQAQAFELDITYKNRFGPLKLPAAYTRLILDALEGDQSLFVRDDELRESWRIVTPFLHKLEKENKDPQKYARGSRGPPQADMMAEQYGFRHKTSTNKYAWNQQPLKGNL